MICVGTMSHLVFNFFIFFWLAKGLTCIRKLYNQDLVAIIRYNELSQREQMREWNMNKTKIHEKIEAKS